MKVTTMNVSLPMELARYVREKVEGGHYSSVSEVVREALRRLSGEEVQERSFRTLSGARFSRAKAEAAAEGILKLQKRQSLGRDLSIEDLIREGREE